MLSGVLDWFAMTLTVCDINYDISICILHASSDE